MGTHFGPFAVDFQTRLTPSLCKLLAKKFPPHRPGRGRFRIPYRGRCPDFAAPAHAWIIVPFQTAAPGVNLWHRQEGFSRLGPAHSEIMALSEAVSGYNGHGSASKQTIPDRRNPAARAIVAVGLPSLCRQWLPGAPGNPPIPTIPSAQDKDLKLLKIR